LSGSETGKTGKTFEMLNMSSQESARRPTSEWGVVIVGAGPAGLFAALSSAAAGTERILLVDAGPDVDDRRRASGLSREVGWGHPDYERGIGGAGLFSDGKLCLSLDVGGHLEQSLSADSRVRLLGQIEAVFRQLISDPFVGRSEEGEELDRWRKRAAAAGLNFKHYPVAHIGTDRCGDIIVRLRSLLESAGVTIWPRTELLDLSVQADGVKRVELNRDDESWNVSTRQVVLAMGKVGARRQAQLCRQLGSAIESQAIYVGARFETDAKALAPLFEITKDPKYSVTLADGSRVKTHCASEQGEVIPLSYEGLPLAGGHNYFDAVTARSGFSVLWDGLDHGGNPYRAAERIMRQAQHLGAGRLVAQRLVDFAAGRPSRQEDLECLDLTCSSAAAGDLREILPLQFFAAMDELLGRLERLVPGIVSEGSVAYAPAIEWWMERIDVDEQFQLRTAPGIAACGDGSGWSQGIVHAAATGLLAAAGLHGKAADLAQWLTDLAPQPIRT
jgi:uncharacterized FAD-dependent dehydrogenase